MTDEGTETEVTLDRLAGRWSVYQLRRGHRFSTDDLVTAWYAARSRPEATRLLDMGCGIGSVGLTTLWLLDRARVEREEDGASPMLHAVEVQEVSQELMDRSIRYNGLEGRVSLSRGDLRDPTVLPEGASFELITGSPPYFPEGTALMSPHPQRAGARMELKGSVYDYCAAARRWLASGGRFCFVMLAEDPRTEDAPRTNGLVVHERWDIVFREGRSPHLAVLVCGRAEEGAPDVRGGGRRVIRDAGGRWTEESLALRRALEITV